MMHAMARQYLVVFTLFSLISYASAQFGFFDQMFGHGHQQQQQQRSPPGVPNWVLQAESVPCSQYLCPDTLVCSPSPAECPCPDMQDVKCVVPDVQDRGGATVVCVRGNSDCVEVQRLSKKLGK